LRTDIDLETGDERRFFIYEGLKEGEGTHLVPESLGFDLIRDMFRTFPNECRVLLNEAATSPAPDPPSVPPVMQAPAPSLDEDEDSTPLQLPGGPALTLGDMAPKGLAREKEVPQG
jgi:hypothetical protein